MECIGDEVFVITARMDVLRVRFLTARLGMYRRCREAGAFQSKEEQPNTLLDILAGAEDK